MALKKMLLIIDDEKNTRDGLRDALEDHYEVYVAGDIGGAFAALETDPVDVLITDLRLGAEDGMDLMERALKLPKPPICIMMTAYGSVDTAVEAMKRGAYDFVTKPVSIDRRTSPAGQPPCGPGEHDRAIACNGRGIRDDQTGRSLAGHGPHSRRNGNRKRARRACHPRA